MILQMIGIVLLTFVATFLSTLAGFGTSTLMIPLVQFFIPIHQTLVLVGIIHLFTSIWKLTLFHKGIRWKLALFFGGAAVVGSYVGASFAMELPGSVLSRLIGSAIIGYVISLRIWPDFQFPKSYPLILLAGFLGGLSSGALGIGGMIRSTFLIGMNLSIASYLSTLGIAGILLDITRLSVYLTKISRIDHVVLWSVVFALPASLLGAWSARLLLRFVSVEKFQLLVQIVLVIMGLRLIVFPMG